MSRNAKRMIPPAPTFGAVNTAKVLIAASPSRVWGLLFDRSAWMANFAGKQHVDGPLNSVGERALYHSNLDAGKVATRLEEILLLDVRRRLVLRLANEIDTTTSAFVEWRLDPAGGSTSLEMNMYWLDVPEDGMGWPAVQALRMEYVTHTQGRIDGHLQRIRAAAVR